MWQHVRQFHHLHCVTNSKFGCSFRGDRWKKEGEKTLSKNISGGTINHLLQVLKEDKSQRSSFHIKSLHWTHLQFLQGKLPLLSPPSKAAVNLHTGTFLMREVEIQTGPAIQRGMWHKLRKEDGLTLQCSLSESLRKTMGWILPYVLSLVQTLFKSPLKLR